MLAGCPYGNDEHIRLFALRDLACLRLHSASDRELEDFPRCLVLTGSSTSSTLAIVITVASSMLARCASSTPCSTSVYHAPLGFRGSKSWTGTRSSSSAYPRTTRSTCTADEERIDSDVTAYIGTDMCGAVQRRHRSRHKARYPRRCFLQSVFALFEPSTKNRSTSLDAPSTKIKRLQEDMCYPRKSPPQLGFVTCMPILRAARFTNGLASFRRSCV